MEGKLSSGHRTSWLRAHSERNLEACLLLLSQFMMFFIRSMNFNWVYNKKKRVFHEFTKRWKDNSAGITDEMSKLPHEITCINNMRQLQSHRNSTYHPTLSHTISATHENFQVSLDFHEKRFFSLVERK